MSVFTLKITGVNSDTFLTFRGNSEGSTITVERDGEEVGIFLLDSFHENILAAFLAPTDVGR